MAGSSKGKGGKLQALRVGGGGGGAGGPGGGGSSWLRLDYVVLFIISLCAVLLTWKFSDRIHSRLWPRTSIPEGGEIPPLVVDWRAGDGRTPITILTDAVGDGAVCLDGTPAAYYMEPGTGEGAKNWIVFLEGGGWCHSHEDCLLRARTQLGSSKYMTETMRLSGIMSSSASENPDFHSWNRVYMKYCDGASFNSDVPEPVEVFVNNLKSGKKVYYRGQRIWTSVMKDLLAKGMDKAEKALLAGCSAGGLATSLHCDQFSDLLPKAKSVKCLSDGGFFIHVPDITGYQTIEEYYAAVVTTHDMGKNLPKACTSRRSEPLCMFAEYFIAGMKTPISYVNSAYDTWQFDNVLIPATADLQGAWSKCRSSLYLCTDEQMKIVQGFREDLLKRLRPVLGSKEHGAFIDSCYLHCQLESPVSFSGPKVDGKTISNVVGDWYFGRNVSKVVDCPFPCNPTCALADGLY